MANEVDKLLRAREIMNMLIQGVNPVSGIDIINESFLHDPKMIRCFSYIVDILSKEIEYQGKKHLSSREKFDPERIDFTKVSFPDNDCGVNTLASCINDAVDERVMKKITGIQINKQLKAMGILAEEKDELGKSRTVVTSRAIDYGIISVKSSYNGREYDKVLFNDNGKQFIINHFIEIMNYPSE